MQETFSAKIIALRKEKRWTQEKLAEKCGISRQAVAKWENGQSVPDVFRIIELANLFQVEINELMSNPHSDVSFRYCTESFGNLYQMIFVLNLAQNKYRLLNYSDEIRLKKIDDEGSIDNFIKTISRTIQNFEQNQKFINLFCRKNLIHLWQEGNKKISLRNLHCFDNNEQSWIECTVCFVNKNSEPVCVFLIRTVDDIVKEEKKKQEEILGRQYIIDVLTNEYDSAHLINLTEDTLYLLKFNNCKLHEYIHSTSDIVSYSKNFLYYIHNYIKKEEQKEIEKTLSPENIKEVLSTRKSFSTFFTVIINNEIHRYEARCIRINDTSDFCVAIGFINRDFEVKIAEKRNMYEEIIKTLAIDYDSVYLANLDSGKILYSYTDIENIQKDLFVQMQPEFDNCFSEEITPFHKEILHPADYEEFKKSISREIVTKELEHSKSFAITYRLLTKNDYEFYQTRIFRSINFENDHNFVVAIKNIDAQITRTKSIMIQRDIDSLSGILNKNGFMEEVSDILNKCNFDEYVYAMFLIDIKNFNRINETFGFSIGDFVLVQTAKKLCLIFSSDDTIARLGGDKFAIFLKLKKTPSVNPESIIKSKAESICKALQDKYCFENTCVLISCCVGISVVNSKNLDFDILFDQADTVLQKIKTNSNTSFEIFQE